MQSHMPFLHLWKDIIPFFGLGSFQTDFTPEYVFVSLEDITPFCGLLSFQEDLTPEYVFLSLEDITPFFGLLSFHKYFSMEIPQYFHVSKNISAAITTEFCMKLPIFFCNTSYSLQEYSV